METQMTFDFLRKLRLTRVPSRKKKELRKKSKKKQEIRYTGDCGSCGGDIQ